MINAKLRKANPLILLIIIHLTTLIVLHISTGTKNLTLFFPRAYNAIGVISNYGT